MNEPLPVPGDHGPELEKTLDAAALMAYGAATWDWHRLHYDQHYAEERGLPAPVVDGQLFGALAARAAVDWLGPQTFVKKLALRMRAMVFAGDRVCVQSEVTNVQDDGQSTQITLAQRIVNGSEVAAEITTVVRLPGTGLPPA